MPTAMAELLSGPCAGSRTPISWVPTFGKTNTWLDARAGVPPVLGVVVLPPPHAARITSKALKSRKAVGRRLEGLEYKGLHTNRLTF